MLLGSTIAIFIIIMLLLVMTVVHGFGLCVWYCRQTMKHVLLKVCDIICPCLQTEVTYYCIISSIAVIV